MMKKAFGWFMLAISVGWFAASLLEQQYENRLSESASLLAAPSPQWSELFDPAAEGPPTTMPYDPICYTSAGADSAGFVQ